MSKQPYLTRPCLIPVNYRKEIGMVVRYLYTKSRLAFEIVRNTLVCDGFIDYLMHRKIKI